MENSNGGKLADEGMKRDLLRGMGMRKLLVLFYSYGLFGTAQASDEMRVQWNGSGCSPTTTVLDTQGSNLRAHRDDLQKFFVQRGPQIPLKESRKNCALIISPTGLTAEQIAVEKIILTGTVKNLKADELELSADVSVQGQRLAHEYKLVAGAEGDSFTRKLELSPDKLIWTDCKIPRALTLNIKERITGSLDRNLQQQARLERLEVVLARRGCKGSETKSL